MLVFDVQPRRGATYQLGATPYLFGAKRNFWLEPRNTPNTRKGMALFPCV